MKKMIVLFAMGAMSLTACSKSSSDSKPVEPRISEETEISSADMFKLQEESQKKCVSGKFDPSIQGTTFRDEMSSFDGQNSYHRLSTNRISKATESSVVIDMNLEAYEVSVLPGIQIYKDNKMQSNCSFETSSGNSYPRCEEKGELTETVKEYIQRNGSAEQRDEEKCEDVQNSSHNSSKTKYSQAMYRLDSGRKIKVYISRTESVYEQKCEKRGQMLLRYKTMSASTYELHTSPEKHSCHSGTSVHSTSERREGSGPVTTSTYTLLNVTGR